MSAGNLRRSRPTARSPLGIVEFTETLDFLFTRHHHCLINRRPHSFYTHNMAQITGFWTRHPRYTFAGALLSILLIFALTSSPGEYTTHFGLSSSLRDYDLPRRLMVSDSIYNEFLQDREKLIQKFGPTRKDVALYVSSALPARHINSCLH